MGATRRSVRWVLLLTACLAAACESDGGGTGGAGGDGGGGGGGDGSGGGGLPFSLAEAQSAAVRASTCTGEDLGEVLLAMGLTCVPDVDGNARCEAPGWP